MRGVAHSAEESEELYTWASNVVAQACFDRRNVRVSDQNLLHFFLLNDMTAIP
jgi:hypothetical protein